MALPVSLAWAMKRGGGGGGEVVRDITFIEGWF
jgi:hypothetical protein